MVEVANTQVTYDVEYKDKNYSVVFNTDHNIGYTDINVYHEGELIEVSPLHDEIVKYVVDTITEK